MTIRSADGLPPFNDPAAFLAAVGLLPDEAVPLASTALALAALDMPGISPDRYQHALDRLGGRVADRFKELLSAGAVDDAGTRLAALKHVLVDEDGYDGDREAYDLLDNASLIRVIDRRRGLPVALAILYLHAGRAAGFDLDGLNFPGHFLIRLRHAGQVLVADPFERCAVLGAPEMRVLLKKTVGEGAELSAAFYQPVTSRDILIRLQNNIKRRQIEAGDYAGALRTVGRMRILAPGEFRLLLDAGVLSAKQGDIIGAVALVEDYLSHLPPGHPGRPDALSLLADLRDHLT